MLQHVNVALMYYYLLIFFLKKTLYLHKRRREDGTVWRKLNLLSPKRGTLELM